jgi:hypothetical protein
LQMNSFGAEKDGVSIFVSSVIMMPLRNLT